MGVSYLIKSECMKRFLESIVNILGGVKQFAPHRLLFALFKLLEFFNPFDNLVDFLVQLGVPHLQYLSPTEMGILVNLSHDTRSTGTRASISKSDGRREPM